MTSGQEVSEYLDTVGLVKSYFSSLLREKKTFFKENQKKKKKIRKKNVLVSDAPEDEAISSFAGLLANPDVPLSLT
jgi:hypothetical protein